jgi:transcription initiation factor TFIIF subunit beta
LLGAATREYNARPLPTKDYIEFTKRRNREAISGKNQDKTMIMENVNEHAQSVKLQSQFKNFIKSNTPARSQINKAARIPKNDLIDMLHQCFDEYTYWPMKALKARTRQPEAYLKEVLGDIAVLVKTGPFSSNWMRQGMYGRDLSNQVDAIAPDMGGVDDDDEEPMEDVIS